MIFLYFIRHLPTKSNIKNLWCGSQTDLDIDEVASKKIIASTAKRMSHFDFVYTSPLKRCIQTCLAFGINNYQIDCRLIERSFGKLEQQPCSVKDKQKLANWELNTDLNLGVEKIQDIYNKKLIPFMNDIKKLPDGSKVLIVSHSWIGRLLKFYFSNNDQDIETAPKNGDLMSFRILKN